MNRWVLGIDTSSTELGIGLWNDDGPACGLSRYRAGTHAEHIAQAVGYLLSTHGLGPDDITHVAVAAGPGSFTGLRIGAAFVKGFCFMRSTPVCAVSSLHALAAGAGLPDGATVVTAFDARRGDVFWARFTLHGGTAMRQTDDRLCGGADFVAALSGNDYVITDALGYPRSTLPGSIPAGLHTRRAEDFPVQRGLACAGIAANTPADSPLWMCAANLTPHYIRSSAAQEKMTAGK